jgi:hypothetical protein
VYTFSYVNTNKINKDLLSVFRLRTPYTAMYNIRVVYTTCMFLFYMYAVCSTPKNSYTYFLYTDQHLTIIYIPYLSYKSDMFTYKTILKVIMSSLCNHALIYDVHTIAEPDYRAYYSYIVNVNHLQVCHVIRNAYLSCGNLHYMCYATTYKYEYHG